MMTLAPVFLVLFIYVAVPTSAKPMEDNSVDERIVGGAQVSISKVPFLVQLRWGDQSFCGGTLISKNYVVTAAHCLDSVQPSGVQIVYGSQTFFGSSNTNQVLSITKHPNYNSTTKTNDISVLKLKNSVNFTSTIQAIPLASALPPIGASSIVSGYGTTSSGGLLSGRLVSTVVPIVSVGSSNYSPDMITRSMFLAGAIGADSCQGDSGGPLVYDNELVGIVSWGNGCAEPGYPGVYTSVPELLPWINNVLKQGEFLSLVKNFTFN